MSRALLDNMESPRPALIPSFTAVEDPNRARTSKACSGKRDQRNVWRKKSQQPDHRGPPGQALGRRQTDGCGQPIQTAGGAEVGVCIHEPRTTYSADQGGEPGP